MEEKKFPKSKYAEREEQILDFWRENKIFEKSLSKESPKGEYVFYEGPPTANAKPLGKKRFK
jgi:isoleucyl-tRNA synthetase